MKIVCDACSAKYSIADEKVRGKVFKIRCKKCSNIIVVRGVTEEGEPAQPGFDHKETHVFDYSNYGDDGNATAAEEAAWHVVVDQEQIGPMTAAEVRDRFARGEIDADTYTWREGFDDWERLGSLEPFADLVAGGAAAAAAPASEDPMAGLFGGPALEDSAAAQSDPADLFTAQTGVGDVIAGGAAAAAPAEGGGQMADSLFSGQPAAGAGAAAEAGNVQIASQLTGQRSENSVLFSLNNLASLASDSPKAQAAPAPSASASGGSAGGVTEGSGLIDIRSMASVYLGERKASPAQASGSADDLPMFSSGSFESASPVLLPSTSSSAPNNRLIYILMAVIGVLVLAATVLVVYVVKNSGKAKTPVATAAEPTAATTGSSQAAKEAGSVAGSTAPKTAPAQPANGGAAGSVDPGTAAAAAAAAKAGANGNHNSAGSPAATHATAAHAASHDHRHERRNRSHSHDHSHHASHAAAIPSPAPSHTSSSSSGGCDEVTCLVSPNKPCCRKYHKGGSSHSSHSSSSRSNLPDRLSRGDVISGINRVKGRVSSCGSRYNGHGVVNVHIHIAPSGRVSGASVSGASGGLASCVRSAVRRAHFKRSKSGMSVTYPFVFR